MEFLEILYFQLSMRLLLTVILSVFLFTIPVFSQSEKPQTIIVPTGSLGEISETRIKILEKTLESKLDDYFDIVPKQLFEEAQETTKNVLKTSAS